MEGRRALERAGKRKQEEIDRQIERDIETILNLGSFTIMLHKPVNRNLQNAMKSTIRARLWANLDGVDLDPCLAQHRRRLLEHLVPAS
jgi:hypothetical protein